MYSCVCPPQGCRKLTNGGMEMIAGLTWLTSLNLHGVKRLHAAGLQPLRGLLLLELTLGSSCVKVCVCVCRWESWKHVSGDTKW